MIDFKITFWLVAIILMALLLGVGCNKHTWVGVYDSLDEYDLDGVYVDTLSGVDIYGGSQDSIIYLGRHKYEKYTITIQNDTIAIRRHYGLRLHGSKALYLEECSYSNFRVKKDSLFTKAYLTYKGDFNIGIRTVTLECDELDTLLLNQKGEIILPFRKNIIYIKNDKLNKYKPGNIRDVSLRRLKKRYIKDCS